jgi:OOP family OmpA-OmpF porin
MGKFFFAALLGLVLTMPMAAQAGDSYLKFGVGQSEYKVDDYSEGKTAVSLGYGFSVDKNFDIEFGYLNLGKLKYADGAASGSIHAQSIYVAGVSTLPVTDKFSVFGKLGIAINHFKGAATALNINFSETETKTRALLGLGLAYDFTQQIAGTLEYQYLGKIEDTKLSALTVGLKYGF